MGYYKVVVINALRQLLEYLPLAALLVKVSEVVEGRRRVPTTRSCLHSSDPLLARLTSPLVDSPSLLVVPPPLCSLSPLSACSPLLHSPRWCG